MRPFLGTNLGVPEDAPLDGKEFLIRTPSEAMLPIIEKYNEETADEIDKQISSVKKGIPLMMLKYLCLYSPLFVLIASLNALMDGTAFREVLSNGTPIYVGTLIAFMLGLFLHHREKLRDAAEEAAEQSSTDGDREGNEIYSRVMEDMGVPSDAKELEVLYFDYKIKNGEYINKCKSDQGKVAFYNGVFSSYSDAENLYLADMDGVYAFPRSSLVALRTVEKKCELTVWLKDKSIEDEEFSAFHLKEDSEGDVHCNAYHVLEFNRDGEVWGIYFPSYEIRALEEWCGLKAE